MRTTLDTKLQMLARKTLTEVWCSYDEVHAVHGRSPRSIFPATGASSSPTSRRWPTSTLASRGGAGKRRPLRPHRLAAPRDPGGFVSKQRTIGIVAARRHEMGQDQGPAAGQSEPGARARRRRLCDRRPKSMANTACSRCRKCPAPWWSRIRGPGACSPWSAAFPTTRASSTAPRRRCASPAPRSSRSSMPRARQRLHALDVVLDAPLEIDQGPGLGVWKPENYERQFLRPLDAALRHRAFAQRDDGAAGAGHRHAADRRIRQALRHL